MAAENEENMDISDIFHSDSDESDFSGFDSSDLEGDSEISSGSESDNEPLIRYVNANKRNEEAIQDDACERWTLNDRSNRQKSQFSGPRPGSKVQMNKESREIDFFLLFFPIQLIVLLVDQTNLFAQQKIATKPDHAWVDVTLDEMKAFLGIRVFMSLNHLPSYRMYWSSDWLFGKLFIPNIMKRDRFNKIMQYFHVNDRANMVPRGRPGHDKLFLIRPILNVVQEKCLHLYNANINTSIDEAMVAFRGRLGFRQYLPAKPTKYGIKVWVRADPTNGYVNDFQIYTGREDRAVPETDLASRVVLDLTHAIRDRHHIVNVDNFFTSPNLLEKLLERGTYARGTVRPNRRNYPATLFEKKDFKNRGQYKTASKGDLLACAWMDRKLTFFLSSADSPAAVDSTTTRKLRNGTQAEFTCPSVVNEYNQYMNGVDRADQLRTEYASYRTPRKWWVYLFWFLFDTALTNAFILMKESVHHQRRTKGGKAKKLTLMEFRMNLSKQLIGNVRSASRKVLSAIDPNGHGHFPRKTTKGRCRQCSKQGIRCEPKVKCASCNVNLCIDCFEPYHANQ